MSGRLILEDLQVFSSHFVTGRGCAGLPALTEMRNFKKRQRGVGVL
jgi:hypothetical protein